MNAEHELEEMEKHLREAEERLEQLAKDLKHSDKKLRKDSSLPQTLTNPDDPGDREHLPGLG